MNCWERFINWLNISNIPTSEQSILRDLKTIGIIES
jgi:hypothetical protein